MPTSCKASETAARVLGSHGRVLDQQAFLDDLTDRQAWRQRAIGVLEDDLHLLAQRTHLATLKGLDVAAKIEDRTFRGGEPQESKTESGLAGTRLADDAERLAGAHPDVDAVHRLDISDGASQQAALDREPDLRRRASTITGAEGTKGGGLPLGSASMSCRV